MHFDGAEIGLRATKVLHKHCHHHKLHGVGRAGLASLGVVDLTLEAFDVSAVNPRRRVRREALHRFYHLVKGMSWPLGIVHLRLIMADYHGFGPATVISRVVDRLRLAWWQRTAAYKQGE